MKICLVGHHVQQPDEGVRKVTYYLGRELARKHDVLPVGVADRKGWTAIRALQPDIIHYVLSPTLAGLAVAKLLSFTYKPAATVISAPHPDLRSLGKAASLFRPDLLLVQAEDSERRFRSLGYRTQFLPNGVDVERFMPASGATKGRLRDKYKINNDRFVILHVASLKRRRNLQVLKSLQQDNCQVLIVGRPSEAEDSPLMRELREHGCMVWTDHFAHIEEIYALSDCYVFPTADRRYCIEMPLSVLEAMSCNLPVVTTRFGALPRVFEEGDGLVFVDSNEQLLEEVRRAKLGSNSRTREKVLPYAWRNVVSSLEAIYEQILDRGEAQGARSMIHYS
ncbi:MAG: glycosyltransferase family 4 protein [Anaerolineae bacterium]